MSAVKKRCWAILPAAGSGSRMGSATPKQYLQVLGRPVIEYSLEQFCRHSRIDGVVVVLAADDSGWSQLSSANHPKIYTVTGGAERCLSVRNGLLKVAELANPEDRVLVHDAARPCLHDDDLHRLMDAAFEDDHGVLLATPVRDTMKRSGSETRVSETVSRAGLWHALTPQIFPVQALLAAVESAIASNIMVTDESEAMERTGRQPRLIEGRHDNIKITTRADLALAEFILKNRSNRECE